MKQRKQRGSFGIFSSFHRKNNVSLHMHAGKLTKDMLGRRYVFLIMEGYIIHVYNRLVFFLRFLLINFHWLNFL